MSKLRVSCSSAIAGISLLRYSFFRYAGLWVFPFTYFPVRLNGLHFEEVIHVRLTSA